MKYKEIEDIFSAKRMQKYVMACGGDTRRAMTLYRYNLKLSQEMYTLISCFEVALRNRIDKQMVAHLGNDWLRDLVMPGGNFYSDRSVEKTKKIITNAYNELQNNGNYSHSKLLSAMYSAAVSMSTPLSKNAAFPVELADIKALRSCMTASALSIEALLPVDPKSMLAGVVLADDELPAACP